MKAALVAILILAAPAFADPKLTELATGYQKEAASCQIHADGVAKVDAGGKLLLGDGPDDAVAADVAKLDAAQLIVQAYCDEVAAVLALLHADPNATYKALEHQLDDRDNKIRKLRQSSKKTLDNLQPVIQRMIPKINARGAQTGGGVATVARPATVQQQPQTKFPSGRVVELPEMSPATSGAWRLSGTKTTDVATYVGDDKATTTITVRAFTGATCEQQRKSIAAKDVANVMLTPAERDAAWNIVYTQGKRTIQALCVASDSGGYLWTIETPLMTAELRAFGGDDAMTKLALQMLQRIANRGFGGSGSVRTP